MRRAGKPGHLQVLRETPGLIPAHAGKTAASPPPRPSPRAHPRSRGENVSAADAGAAVAGSSPLTRGKQDREARGAKVDGLIPAHAGKTSLPFGAKMKGTAHPRSRGENGHTKGTLKCISGSSPLTRGKLVSGSSLPSVRRLIPAHAGKTTRPAGICVDRRAHPRSRGENQRAFRILLPDQGSSPLTRGKLRDADY